MKKFALGLLSAAALATTVLLVRQQKVVEPEGPQVAPGEPQLTHVSIQRMRELGL